MYHFEVERTINAPPERIWGVLTNAQKLADGTFGITRIEGEIAPGSRMKLWSAAAPNRAFALKVIEMTPCKRMVWKGGMPFGLFTGTRVFTLTPSGGRTKFTMREDYSGPMTRLIWPSIPDLTPSFRQFADALANATEARS